MSTLLRVHDRVPQLHQQCLPSVPARPLPPKLSLSLSRSLHKYGPTVCQAVLAEARPAADFLGLSEDINKSYLLGHVLGAGSYGVVKYAYHKSLGAEVAVKVLSKTRNGAKITNRSLRKLERELDIHGQVQECPNVVALYDAFEDESSIYICMEYCGGPTLEKHLVDNGPLTERETALVMRECLKVLHLCHSKSILHGDVKGQNFLLASNTPGQRVADMAANDPSGRWLRAIDFGCSQRFTGVAFVTRVGTPVFMAPEVWSRHYGLAADCWSLGMLFYELFVARFPFWKTLDECKTRTLDEVMKAVIVDDIRFDFGPWLDISPAGLDFVQRLLERDPAKRMNVYEAMNHPWLFEQLGTATNVDESLHNNNIVAYQRRRSFAQPIRQQVVLASS